MLQEIQIAFENHVAVTAQYLVAPVPAMLQEIQITTEIHVTVTVQSIS